MSYGFFFNLNLTCGLFWVLVFPGRLWGVAWWFVTLSRCCFTVWGGLGFVVGFRGLVFGFALGLVFRFNWACLAIKHPHQMVVSAVVLHLSSALSLLLVCLHGRWLGMSFPLGFCLVGGWSVVVAIIVGRWGRRILRRESIVSRLVGVVRLSLSSLFRLPWFLFWMILFTCRAVLLSGVLIFGMTWSVSGWLRLSGQWAIFNP
jgi:hypothetical protein